MKSSIIAKTLLACASFCLAILCNRLHAQKDNLVYVDKEGVMRWTKDKKEASFFGVNYTVPFAYGYRSVKALGIDIKTAIDQDVYHFSRLGLDAFRVHIWDTEITDSLGNLLENDHLEMFDYLLFKLKERNIKTLITPIAFWGNGYPERDERTPGFSRVYGKGQSVVKEEAIKAQENYLQQILKHINPYTKTTYRDDRDIIAIEINNEPHHSGPKEKTTDYVNRLAAAIRSTGWTKPVFYNISESPSYSDAIAKANVQGHSFQWYPSGLVANREQKGNFLPNVDRYTIPFDSVPAYRNKARMVYEFDAADILQPYMYPAMARSYRTAGFQWCTQFAYDPMATAYGNTEYQTHYLNLAYTPAKAISLMIASKVFHMVPRLKSYGAFPPDTVFDVFRVSYKNSLSEMNSPSEFYYSNNTDTKPTDAEKLRQIAGVGNSVLVQYEGSGAYFLDKINASAWRLEVMPDAIHIRDPFERASPKKEVTRIEWRTQKMKLTLPGLANRFTIKALNEGNSAPVSTINAGESFYISPGTYVLSATHAILNAPISKEFIAPKGFANDIVLNHTPPVEVSAAKSFSITVKAVGLDTSDKLSVELRTAQRWRNLPLKFERAGEYSVEVPADAVLPGVLNYRLILQRINGDYHVFPGNVIGNPYAWDNFNNETYQLVVAGNKTALEVFNATTDRTQLMQYNPDWRNNSIRFVPANRSSELAVRMTAANLKAGQAMGWQFYFGDKINGRTAELSSFKTLVVKLRADSAANLRIGLIDRNAACFSSQVTLNNSWNEVRISLDRLAVDSILLLPRPYPGFLPLWFKADVSTIAFDELEKIQFVIYGEGRGIDVEIASAWLEK